MFAEILKDALESNMRQRVVRNVMRVKQMRVRVSWLGKLGGTADYIRPLYGNMQGTFLFCNSFLKVYVYFYRYEKEKQYKISKENHKQTSALGEVLSSLVLLRLCMSESGFSLKYLY